jgi:alkylated DNA repair dioxygenase AlkB
MADRLFADGLTPEPFDEMLVNEYLPGQGIALRRDYAPFGRTVTSLSLLSPCVMEFRHPGTGRRERVLLDRRSLLVLRTEVWHGIPLVRARRIFITFRVPASR